MGNPATALQVLTIEIIVVVFFFITNCNINLLRKDIESLRHETEKTGDEKS